MEGSEERKRDLARRKDLLSPQDAKEESLRRLANALPDLPAFVIVLIMGGLGAMLAAQWHLNIGEKELVSTVSSQPLSLRIGLGCVGGLLAVFLLARTDTSKLIHCSLVALLSGMAGPYLILKSLSAVGVGPELVSVDGAIAVVKTTTETLEREIQNQSTGTNPAKIIDAYQQTAQSTASILTVLKDTSENGKANALARTKRQLQDTLKVLNKAAGVAPEQSLSLLKKVAKEATDAGAPEVAQAAEKIINTNSAVRTAADTAAKSGKVYFITPPEITDPILQDLNDRIHVPYELADIQSVVHPTRPMDDGLEIIYYRDVESDKQTAEGLSKLVLTYLRGRNIAPKSSSVRKGSDNQTSTSPFQFDIHIGPDIAMKLISSTAATMARSTSEPSVKRTKKRR